MRRNIAKLAQSFSRFQQSAYSHSKKNFTLDYQQFQPKNTRSLTWIGFLCGFVLTDDIRRRRQLGNCAEEVKEKKIQSKADTMSRDEKLELVRQLRIHEVGIPSDFPEGVLREITVKHEGNDFRVLVVRVDGKLYATGAYDTYDDKSRLAEGVIFGDKLYSPNNGCAFNVKTGTVEYGPALDNLPIFATGERDGKAYIWVPVVPPKKVRPMTCYRDYNDVRKVVIIGSGIAALTAIETLRSQGYTGDIKMITKDLHLPYDKTKLIKKFKNMDYNKLYLREEEYYEDHGIDFQLAREAVNVVNRHGGPYIELSDGYNLEYDALLVATGMSPEYKEIPGATGAQNCFYLQGIDDHKSIVKKLDQARTISLIGVNNQSLEVASTLRREYPSLKVNIIDENETLWIDDKYGEDVGKAILDLHKKNGVKFILDEEIEEFRQTNDEVKQIAFKNGEKVNTDMVIYFPNNYIANTEWLTEGENVENLEFDAGGRLKTDFHQRSDHKRIFAAGDSSSAIFFSTGQRLACENWYVAYHQGVNAALNMLALKIPYTTIPYWQTEQHGKTLRYTGFTTFYNEVHIEGSIEKWDFIAYYAANDEIMAAVGTDSKKKEILVINEALRLQMMPELSEIKAKYETPSSIEKAIKQSRRSGCFKDLITAVNDKPYPQEVLWVNRENQSDSFFNFYQEGLKPGGANDDSDPE